MPVAAIALPCPVRPCFPDLDLRNFNQLCLISFRLARARMHASVGVRRSSQCVGRAAAAGPTVARASAESWSQILMRRTYGRSAA